MLINLTTNFTGLIKSHRSDLRPCAKKKHAQLGFTLVELIFVLVVLGLVGAIGSSFLVDTMDMYQRTTNRVKLMQKGRVAIEQMSRYFRSAVPNSVRISSTGKCVEFVPVVAGGYYINQLPDSENGGTASSSVVIAPLSYSGSATQFIVAPLSTSDIYTAASASARAGVSAVGASSITLSGAKLFTRNSTQHRYYLAANPKRFCFVSGSLYRYSGYGFLTSALDDTSPGGSADLMLNQLNQAATNFSLSTGSEQRNTSVGITLSLSAGTETVVMRHKVLVRNVP
ncbi:MAG TPA: prepilin-type N-terminal cleavage/methylation domain-containing protein [Cellvibrionaceae bacterium]